MESTRLSELSSQKRRALVGSFALGSLVVLFFSAVLAVQGDRARAGGTPAHRLHSVADQPRPHAPAALLAHERGAPVDAAAR